MRLGAFGRAGISSDDEVDHPGEGSGQVDNLTGLGSRNDSFEVRVFAAFEAAFAAFGRALDATLLLLLLFLSADTFSLAFIHVFRLRGRTRLSTRVTAT